MKKSSQIQSVDASVSAVPERVSVAMAEIAENMGEGLLALAVGAGLQVMAALMEADVSALAGPKGKHDQARTAVRHGHGRGSVTLGGRRVPVTRPRVRTAEGEPTTHLFGQAPSSELGCDTCTRGWARVDFKCFADRELTTDLPGWSCGGIRIGLAELPVARCPSALVSTRSVSRR
jgi:hypothetical protein